MADPAQANTSASAVAAQLASQVSAPTAATAPPGATIGAAEEAHFEAEPAHAAGDFSMTADGQPKTSASSHLPTAPAPRTSSSSSSGTSTRGELPALNEKTSNTTASVDEKVVERIQAQKAKEQAQAGTGAESEGGKDKKKKKKAFFDKRTPLEIALEDPELAHLSPEYRKIVAEQ
ncbi:hypothetical protein JCM3770_003071, partial [Rhodotorula araucariae]